MNVDKIVKVINEGKLVISPTDTVYGIMGDALNDEVIKRVFFVKKRDVKKPLILLMNSIEMISEYTCNINELEQELINKYHPGLLTIILKKNDKISNLITGGLDTVGIRIPDNKDLLSIIGKLNRPVISTSANISGSEVITNIWMIENELKENIDYIEDGGELSDSYSTIVVVIDGKIKILRDGLLANQIRSDYSDICIN